jgi:hypothetical protein
MVFFNAMKTTDADAKCLASRKFSLDDQILFAEFSGDFNPIHVDPVRARRTLFGGCILHGVNGVLWAMDQLSLLLKESFGSFSCNFLKPIPLDVKVDLHWDAAARTAKLIIGNEVATVILLSDDKDFTKGADVALKTRKRLNSPRMIDLAIDSDFCEDIDICYRGKVGFGEELFPSFIGTYGLGNLVEMAVATEIVGMELPGLNSLFTQLKVEFTKQAFKFPKFESIKIDERFGLLNMSYRAIHSRFEIEAFFRDPPAIMPSLKQIAPYIDKDEFRDVKALVVGGSRGLGELTAKIISLGGGSVTATYNLGESDARAFADDLIKAGLDCQICHFDVTKSYLGNLETFDQLYYFASPKILIESKRPSDDNLYERYLSVYVDSFKNIANMFLAGNSNKGIFYPSTIFIDAPDKDFAMYSRVKALGEKVCIALEDHVGVKIMRPRLPRMKTDQTLGLPDEAMENSLSVMLPLIREMRDE